MTALVIAAVLILSVMTTAHPADYDFNSIGGFDTMPQGINDNTAVGGYSDGKGVHGFTLQERSNGSLHYTYFDCQDARLLTDAIGINKAGTIVGVYLGSDKKYHGFVRSGTVCTPVDVSGATETFVTGVNDAGTIVGYYRDSNGTYHGFVQNGAKGTHYHDIDYPGANNYGTHAHGINNAGTVVGWYNGSSSGRGFVATGPDYNPADYTPVDYAEDAIATVPYGINNAGTIAGWYDPGDGEHGFTLKGTQWQTLDHPYSFGESGNSFQTYLYGINDAEWVVGSYGGGGLSINDPFVAMPTGVSLSGTVIADYCSSTSCSRNPFPGVVITATSGDSSYRATTESDGTYLLLVPPNQTYTLTPSSDVAADFDPDSLTVTPKAATTNLDFTGCVSQPLVSADAHMAFQASAAARKRSPCDPDGLDWSMPERLVAGNDFNASTYGGANGVVSHSTVYPPGGWTVDLTLTKKGNPAKTCGASGLVDWEWEVSPSNLVIAQPDPGCSTSMVVKQLGKYTVTAKKYTRPTTSVDFTYSGVSLKDTVNARDFLIVGMGDSNGSGEGNPPFFYPKCRRSQASYQFQSALELQNLNHHASVTFVFTSCSGARIEHVYNMPYQGTIADPEGGNYLPPQITQVTSLLTLTGAAGEPKEPRQVDGVILSAGVNNLYFGPLVGFCLDRGLKHAQFACQSVPARLAPDLTAPASHDKQYVADTTSPTTVGNLIDTLQTKLNGLYVPLADALESNLGVASNHVVISQYPDFSHDGNGNTCNTVGIGNLPQWNASCWTWLRDETNQLNYHVSRTSARGWKVAALDQTDFLTHGYCAGGYSVVPNQRPYTSPYGFDPTATVVPNFNQSYFLGAIAGVAAFDKTGGFHPITKGHEITKEAVIPLLCTMFYGNTTCDGRPKD